jgi:hypothetical protein
MRLICPHCKARMRHRTSRAITPLITESWHTCSNDDCAFKVKTLTEMVGYSVPSATPNPAVTLQALERGLKKTPVLA